MEFTVEFYETENHHKPMIEFLDGLEMDLRVRIIKALKLLETNPNFLKEPNSKAIGNGLFELRIKYKTVCIRNIYFFFSGQRIIVTNGFVKKQKKTPRKEKELAKKYKEDWIKRSSK